MVQSLTTFLEKEIAGQWGPPRNESLEYEEAARRFTADCAAARSPTDAQGHLPAMWKLVENVARKYPGHHKKLVGLLDRVHQLPELVIRGETAIVWSDLPFLVEGWDEIYNRPEYQYSEEIVSVIDMYTALEKGPEDLSTQSKADIIRVDVNIPISAQWIRHAGLIIWNCETSLGLSKREDGLWQGSAGFSYPRWKFWKSRASEIANWKLVSSWTRDFAREIVEGMTSIEKQDGF
ncbi:hypothetical protein DER45DRAFT_545172 [Fusarium avenaceum]|nr:hypothetical protein DER45DRAFT_545172 [Fusarium avenaceum]